MLSSEQIAKEWISLTFGDNSSFFTLNSSLLSMMLRSREACVDYMMPLGLHHIFQFDHHMGPDPGGFKADYPIEWCPVYYHRANADSIGVDRSSTGTGATLQYREPYRCLFDDVDRCPEQFLLWFHRVPWTRRLSSGRNVWEELQWHYNHGVEEVDSFVAIWQQAKPYIDAQRWQEVADRLDFQQKDARLWRDVCLKYFGQFANQK
jgi:alpha-glucuronidase